MFMLTIWIETKIIIMIYIVFMKAQFKSSVKYLWSGGGTRLYSQQ